LTPSPKLVTNLEYAEFDSAHDSRMENGDFLHFSVPERGFPMDAPDMPVVRVSQEQALAYCEWLTKKTGKRHRLPTADERQQFARKAFAEISGFAGYANLADKTFNKVETYPPWHLPVDAILPWRPADMTLDDGHRVTAPVGTFKPDALGLYDTFGNVWEWTSSTDTAGRAIAMGGSFATHPAKLNAQSCVTYPPWQRVFDVGFRIVTEE